MSSLHRSHVGVLAGASLALLASAATATFSGPVAAQSAKGSTAQPTASSGIRLAPPVRLADPSGPIDVAEYTGHAGPLYADVFGRGTKDLLVGTFRGHIALWRNEAASGEMPRFVPDGLLEAEGEPIRVHNW